MNAWILHKTQIHPAWYVHLENSFILRQIYTFQCRYEFFNFHFSDLHRIDWIEEFLKIFYYAIYNERAKNFHYWHNDLIWRKRGDNFVNFYRKFIRNVRKLRNVLGGFRIFFIVLFFHKTNHTKSYKDETKIHFMHPVIYERFLKNH